MKIRQDNASADTQARRACAWSTAEGFRCLRASPCQMTSSSSPSPSPSLPSDAPSTLSAFGCASLDNAPRLLSGASALARGAVEASAGWTALPARSPVGGWAAFAALGEVDANEGEGAARRPSLEGRLLPPLGARAEGGWGNWESTPQAVAEVDAMGLEAGSKWPGKMSPKA